MIFEGLLVALAITQLLIFSMVTYLLYRLDRKQQSAIFGISHVWGAVMQVDNRLKNGHNEEE